MDKTSVESYVGKHLLVGITYLDHEESVIEQKQLHGKIVRINEHEGIVVKLHDSDEEYKLPPDLGSLKEAPEGEYRLRATGEVVVNPDFLSSWTLTRPAAEEA